MARKRAFFDSVDDSLEYTGYIKHWDYRRGDAKMSPTNDYCYGTVLLGNGIYVLGNIPLAAHCCKFKYKYAGASDANNVHKLTAFPEPRCSNLRLSYSTVMSTFQRPSTSAVPGTLHFSVRCFFNMDRAAAVFAERSKQDLQSFSNVVARVWHDVTKSSDRNSTSVAIVALHLKTFMETYFKINYRTIQRLNLQELFVYLGYVEKPGNEHHLLFARKIFTCNRDRQFMKVAPVLRTKKQIVRELSEYEEEEDDFMEIGEDAEEDIIETEDDMGNVSAVSAPTRSSSVLLGLSLPAAISLYGTQLAQEQEKARDEERKLVATFDDDDEEEEDEDEDEDEDDRPRTRKQPKKPAKKLSQKDDDDDMDDFLLRDEDGATIIAEDCIGATENDEDEEDAQSARTVTDAAGIVYGSTDPKKIIMRMPSMTSIEPKHWYRAFVYHVLSKRTRKVFDFFVTMAAVRTTVAGMRDAFPCDLTTERVRDAMIRMFLTGEVVIYNDKYEAPTRTKDDKADGRTAYKFMEDNDDTLRISLRRTFEIENGISKFIGRMMELGSTERPRLLPVFPPPRDSNGTPIVLTQEQLSAMAMAITSPVSIISGGAGTGKSAVLRMIVHSLAEMYPGEYFLCSSFKNDIVNSTCANIMTYPDRSEHVTIRTDLYSPASGTFSFMTHSSIAMPGTSRLSPRVLIVDEAAMSATVLFGAMLRKLDMQTLTRVVLVGDENQLPPIGAGHLFKQLVMALPHAHVKLTRCFRTDSTTLYENSRRVLARRPDELVDDKVSGSYLHLRTIPQGQRHELDVQVAFAKQLTSTLKELDPKRTRYADIMLLTPMNDMNQFANGIAARYYFKDDTPIDKYFAYAFKSVVVDNVRFFPPIYCGMRVVFNKNESVDDSEVEKLRKMERKTYARGHIGLVVAIHFYPWTKEKVEPDVRAISAIRANSAPVTKQVAKGQLMGVLVQKLPLRGAPEYHHISVGSLAMLFTVLQPASCITIHRSQSSEYKDVVAMFPESVNLRTNSIFYTAITRARERCRVIGTSTHVSTMINTPDIEANQHLNHLILDMEPQMRGAYLPARINTCVQHLDALQNAGGLTDNLYDDDDDDDDDDDVADSYLEMTADGLFVDE